LEKICARREPHASPCSHGCDEKKETRDQLTPEGKEIYYGEIRKNTKKGGCPVSSRRRVSQKLEHPLRERTKTPTWKEGALLFTI